MRRAVLAGLALALLPAAAAARNGPRYATVADPEVTLRAGPSDKLPEAGTLPAGARVVVDHEDQNGWLAVVAPPGAVSWVPMTLIDFDPARGLPQQVMAHADALLAAGRLGLAQPLVEYRKVTVPDGTLLKVIGPGVKFDGKMWFPVEPPFEDYRYLPKTAVRFDGPANTSFTVRDTAPPGLTPIEARAPAAGDALPHPGANAPGSPDRRAATNPTFARAEEAERAGRYADAEELFLQAARDTPDSDLANRCFARVHTLREKKTGTLASGGREPPGATPVPGGSRPPLAQDAPPGRSATLLPPVRDDRRPDPAAPPTDRPVWSTPGTLVRSALALDGRQTYALESTPGVVVGYVVPGPGVDLGRYARQRVRVFGPSYTHRNLSKPYTVATDIQPER